MHGPNSLRPGSVETSKRKSSISYAVGVLEDARAIAEISDIAFGSGYRSIQELQRLLDKPSGVSIIAREGQEVVGFANSLILTSLEEMEDEFKMDKTWIRSKLKPHLPLAIRKGTVVQENYQGKGIGKQLFTKTQQILSTRGCKAIVTPVWMNGSERGVKTLLESMGYFPVARFDNYWTEDAKEKEYDCPVCGSGCNCGMMLYIKLL